MKQISRLAFSTALHVSSPKRRNEQEQLRQRDIAVRACTSPIMTLPKSITLRSLTGKFPDWCMTFDKLPTFSDRYLDASLTTSTLQSSSICAEHCIRQVAHKVLGNLFSSWWILSKKRCICVVTSSTGMQVSPSGHFVPNTHLLPSDFTKQCLFIPKNDGDAATLHAIPTLLLEWARAMLARPSWKNALVVAVTVSISSCLVCSST